jgi:hypothetical protein
MAQKITSFELQIETKAKMQKASKEMRHKASQLKNLEWIN